MKKERKNLALFDFDGTISTKDTLIEFIQYAVGKPRYYLGVIYLSPILISFKLKIIKNNIAKEIFLSHFFKNWDRDKFIEIAERYSLERLDDIVRQKALDRISWHKYQGDKIVVVSASIDCWLRAWCEREKLTLISTKLEYKDGKLTGKFATPNCYGEEKVVRVHEMYYLRDYDTIYAYGDSSGDRELLELANIPAFKPFRD
jgi:HAD superfamily hydrolase (TIGR01490 family)